MKDRKIRIISGVFASLLFIGAIVQLIKLPGGLIFPGFLLGGIVLLGILLACFLVAFLLSHMIKKVSYYTICFITISLALLVFHYYIYSPTLKIVVPDNYQGEVNLILSNVDNNILTIDSNGIGYINKWTFRKTWAVPKVFASNGENINERCVGFNPSTFWGYSKYCCLHGKEIRSLSFEIVPANKKEKKQYYQGTYNTVDTGKLIIDK